MTYSDDELRLRLTSLLESSKTNLVFWATRVLLALFPDDAIEHVIPLLMHSESSIRSSVCGLLSDVRDARVARALEAVATNDRDANVRWRAVASLGNCGDSDSVKVLENVALVDTGHDYEGRPINERAGRSVAEIRSRLNS